MIEPSRRPSSDLASPGRRRRRLLLAAATVACAAALLVPHAADAGSYVARQCTPAIPGVQASWERSSDHYRSRGRCASGGGLQIFNDAARTAHRRQGAWVWRAPVGTVFTSLRANASLTRHAGHRGQLLAVPVDAPERRFGGQHSAFRVYQRRGEFSRFEARLRCTRPTGCGHAGDDRARARVKGVFLRVTDRSAPAVADAGGSLLDAPVVRGTRALSFAARDRGGGVRRVWVEANGRRIAASGKDCALTGGYATRIVPCPRSVTELRSIDTTASAFRTGPNALGACAEDLALSGRPNSGCERRRVWVDNACPASSAVAQRLQASFAGGSERAVVRSSSHAMLSGRLSDGSGEPVAGATICALTRVRIPGAPVRVAATTRTDGEGRWAIELRPGPNREVFVHHARTGEVLARHGLEVRSRVRPTFKVRAPRRARSGDRLRFRGRLPGPACARRVVEVQARIGARRWQVFRTARTSRRCAYSTAYRLRATSRAVRYRFRTRVRRQPGYPYAPGRSIVRSKRVG